MGSGSDLSRRVPVQGLCGERGFSRWLTLGPSAAIDHFELGAASRWEFRSVRGHSVDLDLDKPLRVHEAILWP